MTEGYIFFGIDVPGEQINLDLARNLSLMLKISDPHRETCAIVHKLDHVPSEYEDDFDYIVELPYDRYHYDDDILTEWWQLYYATPFDNTMYMDYRSLVLGDITSLWDIVAPHDLVIGTPKNFQGNIAHTVTNPVISQHLKSVYGMDLVYFKKSLANSEWFKMADPIFKNWQTIYNDVFGIIVQMDFDCDVLSSYAMALTGLEPFTHNDFDYIDTSLGIKSEILDHAEYDFRKMFNVWISNNLGLKINNHQQYGVVSCRKTNIINQEIINKTNEYHSKKTKTES